MNDILEGGTFYERRLPSKPSRTNTVVWNRQKRMITEERPGERQRRMRIQRGKATEKPTRGRSAVKEEEVVTKVGCWKENTYRSVLFRLSNNEDAPDLTESRFMTGERYILQHVYKLQGWWNTKVGTIKLVTLGCKMRNMLIFGWSSCFPLIWRRWSWWALYGLKGRAEFHDERKKNLVPSIGGSYISSPSCIPMSGDPSAAFAQHHPPGSSNYTLCSWNNNLLDHIFTDSSTFPSTRHFATSGSSHHEETWTQPSGSFLSNT